MVEGVEVPKDDALLELTEQLCESVRQRILRRSGRRLGTASYKLKRGMPGLS